MHTDVVAAMGVQRPCTTSDAQSEMTTKILMLVSSVFGKFTSVITSTQDGENNLQPVSTANERPRRETRDSVTSVPQTPGGPRSLFRTVKTNLRLSKRYPRRTSSYERMVMHTSASTSSARRIFFDKGKPLYIYLATDVENHTTLVNNLRVRVFQSSIQSH